MYSYYDYKKTKTCHDYTFNFTLKFYNIITPIFRVELKFNSRDAKTFPKCIFDFSVG